MWTDGGLVELKPHGHTAVHIAFASSPNEDVVPATPELTVFAFAEFAAKCTLFVTLCRYGSKIHNCKNSNAQMENKCTIL